MEQIFVLTIIIGWSAPTYGPTKKCGITENQNNSPSPKQSEEIILQCITQCLGEQYLRQINYTDTCRDTFQSSPSTAWHCIDTNHSPTQEIPAKWWVWGRRLYENGTNLILNKIGILKHVSQSQGLSEEA